ncbi:hypothetical protein PSTT_01657 [Puccinia striiformis]|uniref:Uncharacterized protein n=1 Tax=Puccinia striiformis TaxID=27350 RepID=A0A2S4W2Z2_9BASI|nr:hypothetical protein PSTT_01657 [Puccinia striiformis]
MASGSIGIHSSHIISQKIYQLLSKLNAQLSTFEAEEAEIADAELLASSPHARPCHRPAYRKLAFENALKQSEEKKNLAEDVYNAAMLAKQSASGGGEPASSEPAEPAEEAEAEEAAPLSPETTTASNTGNGSKPMSRIKKLDAFLTRLESGKGMTKTFAPDRQSPSYGRWSLRAGTFEPGRAKPAP